ncbi:MAG: ATP-binding cassette domain-containing protein [Planctomycetota bacterium]
MSTNDRRAAAAIEACDFTMAIAGKILLHQASFDIQQGELVLLVGPSAVGKSLLLQILAGVLSPSSPDLEVSGTLSVAGENILERRHRRATRQVGILFQDHALLDDLAPLENIQFAADHAPRSLPARERRRKAQELLREFGLEGAPHVRALSGGQRQRLAVARTLAHDPAVLLYDEPTTGLDPANARRVAARIAETHRRHGKTSLIVTHDFASLAHVVDRILLFDAARKRIREIGADGVAREMEALDQALAEAPEGARARRRRPLDHLAAGPRATASAVMGLLAYALHLLPAFPRLRWGLHFLLHELRLVCFPSAMVYMVVTGLILGFVSTYFTFRYLPHRPYTEPLLADEVLAGLGYIMYRVLSPVLATLLIAARCGAAVSSDTGNRAYARQLDALASFGIRPSRYLFTAISWAFLIGTPLLCAIVFLVARAFSLLVFDFTHPQHSAFFWDLHFHQLLLQEGTSLYSGSWWLLAKVETAGAGIAAIAYHQGARPKRSTSAVSLAVTSTIIWATLWVLAVHFAYAFLEF